MAHAKIKKGDTVIVLAGKDKGKTGEVTRVIPAKDKVIVQGVNVAVHHRKPTQQSPEGGLERLEKPLHISNVALTDPKGGAATRVRFEEQEGKLIRIAAKSGEKIGG